MKLLFDQNISFRLLKLLTSDFSESAQVKELNLTDYSDFQIWQFAKKNGFTIVSFDADFADLANLNGHPPKIVWLRIGNTSTRGIAKALIDKKNEIRSFIESDEYVDISCIELS